MAKNLRLKKEVKKKIGLKTFLAETQTELKKVEWPDKATVANASLIIVVFVVFFTGLIAMVDMVFVKLWLNINEM